MVPSRENKAELPLDVLPIEDTNNPKPSGQLEKIDSQQSDPQLLKILCQYIQRSHQVDTVVFDKTGKSTWRHILSTTVTSI